jgi:hypothetical protein
MKGDPRGMKVPSSGRAPLGNKHKKGSVKKGSGKPSPKKSY